MIRLSAPAGLTFRSGYTDDATPVATLSGLVVPWDVEFTRMGGVRFTFTQDSLRLPDDLSGVKLLTEHDPDRPVGYAASATSGPDGLDMTFVLPDHPRTADVAAEVAARLRDGLSVGVQVDDQTLDAALSALFDGQDAPIVLAGELREVSVVSIPQFPTARVTHRPAALLTASAPRQEEPPMHDLPTVDAAAGTFTITDAPEFAELAARVRTLEDGHPSDAHRLSRFASLADVILAGLAPDAGRISLALADNTSNAGANAGVMPPAWATTVHGIITRRRAAVEAFGGPSSLPAAGLDTAWPYFDGDLSALVGAQATQKSEITSVAVNLKKGTGTVKTYAGGADNALQLIERSDPSFLEAWGRIMAAAYAVVTDAAFTSAVALAATGTAALPATPTAAQVRAFLFEASDKVDDVTGAPATFALAAPDVFLAWGQLDGLHTPEYGVQNVAGTASAATLRIDVNGLPVIKARGLGAGQVLVSNPEAAAFREDGPSFIDAINVAKLGRDSAIYGYGATEVYYPGGVVKNTAPGARR